MHICSNISESSGGNLDSFVVVRRTTKQIQQLEENNQNSFFATRHVKRCLDLAVKKNHWNIATSHFRNPFSVTLLIV